MGLPKVRIRKLRQEKGLTPKELALDIGMPIEVFRVYEADLMGPEADGWQKLADYFGVSVPYLRGVSDNDTTIDKLTKQVQVLETARKVGVDRGQIIVQIGGVWLPVTFDNALEREIDMSIIRLENDIDALMKGATHGVG